MIISGRSDFSIERISHSVKDVNFGIRTRPCPNIEIAIGKRRKKRVVFASFIRIVQYRDFLS